MKKTIISVATTGAWPTKKDNPNVPLTPSEIAKDVIECYEAGAAIAHLHVRDDNGAGTMDIGKFRETVGLIRSRTDVDILLNLTFRLHGRSTATASEGIAPQYRIIRLRLHELDA